MFISLNNCLHHLYTARAIIQNKFVANSTTACVYQKHENALSGHGKDLCIIY